MDNELLAKLLSTHSRLIIPGFGAFLRKEGPSGHLIFSPFLKKDDGVLTSIIIEQYGVEHFDAESIVAEWVSHIKDALAANGRYHLESIGVLIIDANGAIAMVAEPAPKPQPTPQPVAPKPIPSIDPALIAANRPMPISQPTVQQSAPQPTQPCALQPITQQTPPSPIPQPIPQSRPVQQQIPQPAMPPRPTAIPARPAMTPPTPRPMTAIPPRPTNPQNWNQQPNTLTPGPAQGMQNAPSGQRPNQPPPQGTPRPAGQQIQGQRPPQGPGRPPQPGRRPKPKRKKNSSELWLIIAIIAALIVTAIIIYSLISYDPNSEMYSPDPVEYVAAPDSIPPVTDIQE